MFILLPKRDSGMCCQLKSIESDTCQPFISRRSHCLNTWIVKQLMDDIDNNAASQNSKCNNNLLYCDHKSISMRINKQSSSIDGYERKLCELSETETIICMFNKIFRKIFVQKFYSYHAYSLMFTQTSLR